MNVIDLEIFLTIAKQGSINKAAKQLNYAQSNITSRLNKFEQSLQTSLFYRTKKGVKITEKGSMLLPLAEQIIALTKDFSQRAKGDFLLNDHLHLSIVENVTKLPVILSKFINEYPEVEVTLTANTTSNILKEVSQFTSDGAFITQQTTALPKNLKTIDIFKDQLVVIAPPQTKTLHRVNELPMLHYNDDLANRDKLDIWLALNKYSPPRTMILNSLDTVIGLVTAGLGYSYAPYSYVESYSRKELINTISIPKPYGNLITRFVYRDTDYLSPSLKALINIIEEIKDSYLNQ